VVFDEIADGGKAFHSCPPGVSRKWGKRAATVDFQVHHYGSGHGIQGEHPPELALTQNSLALFGLGQHYFADDVPALLGGHDQHDQRPRIQTGKQVAMKGAREAWGNEHVC